MNHHDVNKLIYEKSNTYRLHADIVRWALLGGYAAAFAAMLQVKDNREINYLFFLISLAYVFILAVQSWYYNLFAGFVRECEYRLMEGINLRSMEAFARSEGAANTPYHPSFIFALLAVLITGAVFWFRATNSVYGAIVVGFLSLAIFFALFLYWDALVYKSFLRPLSTLFSRNANNQDSRAGAATEVHRSSDSSSKK